MLVAVLGLPPLVGRPLSEQTANRYTYASTVIGLLAAIAILVHDAGPGHRGTCPSNWETGSSFLNSIFTFI